MRNTFYSTTNKYYTPAWDFDQIDKKQKDLSKTQDIRKAKVPDPGTNDWTEWQAILADRREHIDGNPLTSINITTDYGFGTVSSSLLAVPSSFDNEVQWKFCTGSPDKAPFNMVEL